MFYFKFTAERKESLAEGELKDTGKEFKDTEYNIMKLLKRIINKRNNMHNYDSKILFSPGQDIAGITI